MKVTETRVQDRLTFINRVENDHRSIERVPEGDRGYDDANEADAYIQASRSGAVALLEWMFAKRLLGLFRENKPLRVLDVGTGPGWIPSRLASARSNWVIDAVDASPTMLKQARAQHRPGAERVRWHVGVAEALPFSSTSCDLVFSHFALHEFSDPVAALKEIRRVTAPGGLIVIQDLVRPTPLMRRLGKIFSLTYSKRMKRQYDESLRAAYTLEEVRRMALEAGLTARVVPSWGVVLRLTARV